jgi:hypothetical protein
MENKQTKDPQFKDVSEKMMMMTMILVHSKYETDDCVQPPETTDGQLHSLHSLSMMMTITIIE